MQNPPKPLRGRGATENTPNRFEALHFDFQHESTDFEAREELPLPRTQFFKDSSRTIVATNNSPDIPFSASVNPYRGCEHGCAYCYARPTHEYLGMSAGIEFESKIFVKEKAPELLREKLLSKSWEPQSIAMSGVTDCYQPVERKLELTRRCIEVCAEFRNPVSIISKNALVTRDIDLFQRLNEFGGIVVFLSVTTLDSDLCGILEPRTSRPEARLRAIEALRGAGIPVGVNVAPVIPGLTDHEMPAILKAAAQAGAEWAGYTPLRLPLAVAPLFTQWLETHKPARKEKVLSHIRSIRGGKINEAEFGARMRGEGAFAQNMRQMFKIWCAKEKLNLKELELRTDQFQRPGDQLSLL